MAHLLPDGATRQYADRPMIVSAGGAGVPPNAVATSSHAVRVRFLRGGVGRAGGMQRGADLEGGVARLGDRPQVTAVPVGDHAPGDVEAETGAAADALGGEERLEHPAVQVLRHAGPGVDDLDERTVAVAGGADRQ